MSDDMWSNEEQLEKSDSSLLQNEPLPPPPLNNVLPSALSQKLVEEAVISGIHQGDMMLEVMGNIIARRVSDGIESGTFQQNVKFKVNGVMSQLFSRYFPDVEQSKQQKLIAEAQEETDDLTQFIDRLVSARLEQDKRLIENRQKQEKLLQLEEKRKKKHKQEKLETINNWFFIFLISVGLFSLGLYVGINVLPEGVVCVNNYSPCYWLRFDNQKTTLE